MDPSVDPALLKRLYADHVADLIKRYAPVLEKAGFEAVVIHSGSLFKRTSFDDQYWPLRATPHFQHWLPLAQPDCALIVRAGNKPKLAWMRTQSFWERPASPETDHWLGELDIVDVSAPEDVKEHVPAGARVAFIGDTKEHATLWGIAEHDVNPPDLIGPLDRLRVKKTPYEVLCLDVASRRAAAGHEAVLDAFRTGAHSELDLHLLFLKATRQDDPETPYKNIVALGAHAATLHHISYDKRPSSSAAQSLLVDAGSTYQGYASDITRTWCKGTGAAASLYASLVDGVEKMQQRLCAAIKVGAPYEELHEDAHRQIGVILKDIGVVRASAEASVDAGITRAFFPHGLGHSLGLQCHDVGCALVKPKDANPYLRNTSIIAEGQVFTVEPGIYFIEPLLAKLRTEPSAASIDWSRVEVLSALGGVRIEDDLVVTGGANVTRNLTREYLPVGGCA